MTFESNNYVALCENTTERQRRTRNLPAQCAKFQYIHVYICIYIYWGGLWPPQFGMTMGHNVYKHRQVIRTQRLPQGQHIVLILKMSFESNNYVALGENTTERQRKTINLPTQCAIFQYIYVYICIYIYWGGLRPPQVGMTMGHNVYKHRQVIRTQRLPQGQHIVLILKMTFELNNCVALCENTTELYRRARNLPAQCAKFQYICIYLLGWPSATPVWYDHGPQRL